MNDFDCVIIGSGAGGGTMLHALAKTGKKILLIERGDFLPREKDNWNPDAIFIRKKYKTTELWYDKNDQPFAPGMYYAIGGNTKLYGAALLRLRKEDFGEVKHWGGISPAWPITYEEMEPFYVQAEKLYYVHGERNIDSTEPSSSAPFPYPAISHEGRIRDISDKLKKEGYHPFPLPLGLMLDEQNRENCRCIRCDTCDGYPCLVDAKADADVVCVSSVKNEPNITIRTHAKALRLLTDPSGKRVNRVEIEVDGKLEEISAPLFIVSCGAVNSAALLLRSKIANSSNMVGQHYMCHINSALMAISTTPNLTSYQKTLGMNDFYFASSEWEYPMGHIQLLGNVKKEMIRAGAPRFAPDFVLEKMARYTVGWWLSSEDLPDPKNCVKIKSDQSITLNYTGNNQLGHKKLIDKLKKILRKIEPTTIAFTENMPLGAVAHQVGTCRFGKDPKASVLDTHCKTHDLDNVYVVDGSFFPSSAAVNPGLTIIANALRVAEEIKKRI